MKKKIQSIAFAGITLGAASMLSTAASASSFNCSHEFFIQAHFSKQAFGKEVAGVYAHVGAYQKEANWKGGKYFWDDVQHVELKDQGQHYEARIKVNARSSYEDVYNDGARIQYWVYFKDGSEQVTKDFSIELKSDVIKTSKDAGDRVREELESELSSAQIESTTADSLSICTTS